MSGAATQDPPIRSDPTVVEGGILEVTVTSGAREIFIFAPGHARVAVPVINGRAEYQLPSTVRGGARVFVSDMTGSEPADVTVDVVGNQ